MPSATSLTAHHRGVTTAWASLSTKGFLNPTFTEASPKEIRSGSQATVASNNPPCVARALTLRRLWGSKITSNSAPHLETRGERPMTSPGRIRTGVVGSLLYSLVRFWHRTTGASGPRFHLRCRPPRGRPPRVPPRLPPGPTSPSPRQLPPDPPEVRPLPAMRLNQIVRFDRLGGLIHEYGLMR